MSEQVRRKLKAAMQENARLKSQIDAKMEVGVPYADYERLFAENARLKAEVERLTKAGDGVLNSLDLCYMGKKLHLLPSVIAWNAAKGVQS